MVEKEPLKLRVGVRIPVPDPSQERNRELTARE